jgi:hypothetical protein
MTQFEEQVLRDLSELKAHMRWIVGNGNEGKMQELEQRIARHEGVLQRAMGVGGGIAVLIALAHMAFDYLKVSH